MIVQVVINNQMSIFVQFILIIAVLKIHVIARIILAAFLGDSEKDRVVLIWVVVIVPFLQKQNTCFGAGVWLEGVGDANR